VHALKPAPEIYFDALSKLGVRPPECVYVDDIEQYADAARELGMTAIHYRSPLDLSERFSDIPSL
jgi:HAD superfamily hydrolase (TIGR01509 family)